MAIPKYSYQQNPQNQLTGFKIEEGNYKDVIYTYGKVSPIEENEKLRLKFEYNVHENPNKCDTDSSDFINVMGDILAIEVEKDNNGNSGTNREDDTQKSST
jgi:hypothetical protein|tara:strand:- start:434 stop:736 length:303 start_codon:yes stop_codon:yes gene_type:complete